MYPTSPRTVQGTTLSKPPFVSPAGGVTRRGSRSLGRERSHGYPSGKSEWLRAAAPHFRRAVNRRAAGARAYYENRLRLRRAANPVASGPGTLSALACDYRCSVIYRCSENKKGCLTDIPTGVGPDNLGKNLTWKLGSDIYLKAVRLSS